MNTILLVDDEQANLNALARVFSQRDYQLCFAADGDEALERIESVHPALVVLDVVMPGMNGFSVCERIKARKEETMVLMLSGRSELSDRMKGYAVQADDYMIKPYDPDELLAKTDILLRLYKAQNDLKQLNRNLEETVRKRTEELIARERQAMAGAMVKGIVHNLRGPLTVAQNGLELAGLKLDSVFSHGPEAGLPAGGRVKAEVEKYVSMVSEAISRAAGLVDSLLIQGGSNPREIYRSLDLNRMVRDEYHFLRSSLFYPSGVDVKLALAEDLPPVKGKYSDFSQVFYNLARNACEAMADSGEKILSISSRVSEAGIILTFSDSGPGISPQRAACIFDPFYSTKSKEKEEGSGSGLGLFVCSRLMAQYNAVVSVQNGVPSGAVFTIRIPLSNKVKER